MKLPTKFCRPIETFSPRHAVGQQRRAPRGDARGPRCAFRCPLPQGCPARDGAVSDLVSAPRSSRTHRDWITDKEHEAVRALSRSAHQLRIQAGSNPAGRPGSTHAETPQSARGAVWKTVATGCAGSTPGLCTTPATRGRSSAGRGRRWQRRWRGFDPPRLHQHHPLPLWLRGKSAGVRSRRRRSKSSRGTRMFTLAGDESADRLGLVEIASSSANQPAVLAVRRRAGRP